MIAQDRPTSQCPAAVEDDAPVAEDEAPAAKADAPAAKDTPLVVVACFAARTTLYSSSYATCSGCLVRNSSISSSSA
jgi:hypothetical protein